MLFISAFAFTLLATVLAVPTATSLPNVNIDPKQHSLAIQSHALRRRQLSAEDAQAVGNYADILARAVSATTGPAGTCSSECRPWVSAVRSCGAAGGGQTQVGTCSCQEGTISQMSPCATCLGYTNEIGQIERVCQAGLASIASEGTPTVAFSFSNTNTASVVGGGTPTASSVSSGSRNGVVPVLTAGVVIAGLAGALFA